MKNKKAIELLKVLKLLLSKDKEIVELGIGLFQDTFIFKNLPKYKRFSIEYKWAGHHRYIHDTLGILPLFRKKVYFTGIQFSKMLNSKQVPFCKKACLILNLVYDLTKYRYIHKKRDVKNRFYNSDLSSLLRGSYLDDLPNETIKPYIECKTRGKILRFKINHVETTKLLVSETFKDIEDLGIAITTNYIDTSINRIIDGYKKSLKFRYNSKKYKKLYAKNHNTFSKFYYNDIILYFDLDNKKFSYQL